MVGKPQKEIIEQKERNITLKKGRKKKTGEPGRTS
jgi:hypothetical protein